MGRLDLYRIEPSDLYDENLLEKYRFVANQEEIGEITDLIIASNLTEANRVCYLYGFGSQPKSIYRKLKENAGNKYDVLWYGYNGPKKLKLLSYVTASTGGLIKILKIDCIKGLIETLSHLSMVGLFSLTETFAADFENYVLGNVGNLNITPEDFIKMDKGFFYFVFDGDTYDDEQKGFLCKAALGKECPEDLFRIKRFTYRRW